MSDVRITIPPPCEPLSLSDAKLQLRVDSTFTTDDTLIAAALMAARMHVENVTRRQLVLASFELVLDQFPGRVLAGVGAYAGGCVGGGRALPNQLLDDPAIVIYGGPVQTLLGITYADTSGHKQTLTGGGADYFGDGAGKDPFRVMPSDGAGGVGDWPDTSGQIGSVTVTYAAGWMVPFTVNASADTFTLAAGAQTLNGGDAVRLVSIDGALPGGLAANTNYYVVNANQFSATPGGAAINITSAGTGTLLIDGLPEAVRHAVRLLTEFFYENRGDATAEIPAAVGALLSPYKVWRF